MGRSKSIIIRTTDFLFAVYRVKIVPKLSKKQSINHAQNAD